MAAMFGIVAECASHLTDALLTYKGDVREPLACYTTEVIGSCAFGLHPGDDFRRYTRKVFEYSAWKTMIRLLQVIAPQLCVWLRLPLIPHDVSRFFTDAVRQTVRARKANGIRRKDFLQLLIELEEEGLLDEREFAAQSFVFFIAGFETSSTTLAYLLYELSKDDEIQAACRKEIIDAIPDVEEVTYDMVMSLPYLDRVVKETLRMYPALPFLTRECTKEYKVNEELILPVGSELIIPILAVHMDAELYPQPERFNPDRFVENEVNHNTCSYMPFGEGPRKCIGNRFGLMQVKMGAVAILQRYKIAKHPTTPHNLEWDTNSFTLKTRNDLVLTFQPL